MPPLYLAIYALNAAAFALLVRNGRREDWLAVALFILDVVAGFYFDPLTIGSWRAGSALLNTVILIALWALAMKGDRWWLILAVSVQVVTTATHIIPLFGYGLLAWSGVFFRNTLYVFLIGVFFVGAWEAWADRRFRQEANHGPQSPEAKPV